MNKKSFGSDKPRKFAPSGKMGFAGKSASKSKSGFKPKSNSAFGSARGPEGKPKFGKKFSDHSKRERTFGKADHSDDRPRRSFDERPKRSFDDRPKRSFDGPKRSFEDRPKRSFNDRADRPFGDRPHGSGFGSHSADKDRRPAYGENREWSDRKPFKDRKQSDFARHGKPAFSAGGKKNFGVSKGGFSKPGFSKPGFPKRGYEKDSGRRSHWSERNQDEYRDRDSFPSRDRDNFKSQKPSYNREMESKPWAANRPERESDFSPSEEQGQSDSTYKPPFRRDNFKKSSVDLQSRKFVPGLTAKKLIVTLEDTTTVPVRLVWIYDSMVGLLPDGEPAAGDTVHVHDDNDRFLGSAIYNPNSRIRARIFSVSKRLFDDNYIVEAIDKAIALRKGMGLLSNSCRVIFGDSDGLPGLIADKIGDYLVVQPLTYAVNRRLSRIVDYLNERLGPQGIIVRNDAPIRAKEGLEVGEIVTHGEIPERVEVLEDGCLLFADPAGGQKTGLFLDQRLNRAAIKPFCRDAKVLDLFCHVGGWAMRAAKYGAREVVGIDSSKPALEMARSAANANGFTQVSFLEADVFDYMRDLNLEADDLFDIIICDPPAFAKTKAHFEDAFRAYLSLNYLVMKKLKPGGILVTCSCSQAVSEVEFGEAILTAARNARMQFQIIEKRGAPQDHPVLLGLPETSYLKCFVMKRTE